MGKKILVADDSTEIQNLLKDFLSSKGYGVVLASDGEEAVKKAKTEKPDLILMDVNMPKMNGFQALDALKKDKNILQIPVIMLTDRHAPEDIQQGMQSYADKYIPKPFEIEKLLKEIVHSLSLLPPR